MAQHRAVGHRGLDVEHRRFADDDVRAQGHAADLDVPVVRAVAGDRRVLADEGAAPDREQVGGDGDLAGQQDDPRADLRPERTQVEAVGSRAGEHHHRVRPDQDLDDPEAQVRRAPDRDRGRSPSADQHPLEDHGERDEPEEPQRSDADGAQVEVEESGRRRGPVVGPGQEDRDDVGVGQEEQELRRAAEDHRQGAGARSGGRGRGRRHGDGRPRFRGSSRRSEGGRQTRQGGVGVDVGHSHGRQAGVLAHLRAEARHQQRVGAEIVEEVGLGRHGLQAQDLAQDRPEPGVDVRCSRALVRRRGQRRRQGRERRVLVDVLHRHRRQLWVLTDLGAEAGHEQRVGAEIVEEVRARRDGVAAQDLLQDRGERSFDGGSVGGGRRRRCGPLRRGGRPTSRRRAPALDAGRWLVGWGAPGLATGRPRCGARSRRRIGWPAHDDRAAGPAPRRGPRWRLGVPRVVADAATCAAVESGDPLDLAICGDPPEVAGAEHPTCRRPVEEGLTGQVRTADVTASDADAGDPDLADLARRQDTRRVVGVEDDDPVRGKGAPQRRCAVCVQLAPEGGDGALGRTLQPEEPAPRALPCLQELSRSFDTGDQEEP